MASSFPSSSRLVLASSSPQRRSILGLLGVPFTVVSVATEELSAGDPIQVARSNALGKAAAAWDRLVEDAESGPCTVIGADTVVTLGAEIFGKPADIDAARATLIRLSGRTHTVVTAIATIDVEGTRVDEVATDVTFRQLSDLEIEWYLDTGEWRDRAGGYAIQERGATLVEAVTGDYLNVVGLSLVKLIELLPALRPVAGRDLR